MTCSESIQSLTVTEKDNFPEIDLYNIKKAGMVLRALNHKLRLQMITTIYENKRLSVTQIYCKLRLEQSVASQHLSILRKVGIVSAERDGKLIYYKINSLRIIEISQFAKKLLNA